MAETKTIENVEVKDGYTAVYRTTLEINNYITPGYHNIVYLNDGNNRKYSVMLPTPTSMVNLALKEGWYQSYEKSKNKDELIDKLSEIISKINQENLKFYVYVPQWTNLAKSGPATVYVDGLNNYVERIASRLQSIFDSMVKCYVTNNDLINSGVDNNYFYLVPLNTTDTTTDTTIDTATDTTIDTAKSFVMLPTSTAIHDIIDNKKWYTSPMQTEESMESESTFIERIKGQLEWELQDISSKRQLKFLKDIEKEQLFKYNPRTFGNKQAYVDYVINNLYQYLKNMYKEEKNINGRRK